MPKLVWNQEDAELAVKEFKDELAANHPVSTVAIAKIWEKYYMRAGHKLLARELLKIGKDNEQRQD